MSPNIHRLLLFSPFLQVLDLYDELREEHYASLEDRKYIALPAARAKCLRGDWPGHAKEGGDASAPVVPWRPKQLGKVVVESQVRGIKRRPRRLM